MPVRIEGPTPPPGLSWPWMGARLVKCGRAAVGSASLYCGSNWCATARGSPQATPRSPPSYPPGCIWKSSFRRKLNDSGTASASKGGLAPSGSRQNGILISRPTPAAAVAPERTDATGAADRRRGLEAGASKCRRTGEPDPRCAVSTAGFRAWSGLPVLLLRSGSRCGSYRAPLR